jgi:hypothetical protein
LRRLRQARTLHIKRKSIEDLALPAVANREIATTFVGNADPENVRKNIEAISTRSIEHC